MKTEQLDNKLLSENIIDNKALVIKTIIVSISIVILSCGKIFGIISGLGLAAVIALPVKYSVLGLISSVVGYFISGFTLNNLALTVVTLIVVTIKYIAAMKKYKLHQPILLSLLTFIAMATISITSFFYYNQPLSLLFINLFNSIFTMCVTYYSFSFYRIIISNRSIDKYFKYEWFSISLMLCIFICAASSIEFFNINLGIFFAVIFILLCAVKYGVVGGGISGILMLISLGLQSFSLIEIGAVLTICGFIAGVFSELKKLMVISVFLVIGTTLFLLFLNPINNIQFISSIFLGVFGAFFIKDNIISKLPNFSQEKATDTKLFKDNLSSKLSFAACTIKDLNNSLNFVGNKMDNNIKSIYDVTTQIETSLCNNCKNKVTCLVNNSEETNIGIMAMIEKIKDKGLISAEDISDYLKENCIKTNLMVDNINHFYNLYVHNVQKKSDSYNARMLVSEQLSFISDLLNDLCEDLTDDIKLNKIYSEELSSIFTLKNIPINQVSVFSENNEFSYIEMYGYSQSDINIKNIEKILHDVFSVPLSDAEIINVNPYTKISFYKKSDYNLEFNVLQKNYNKNKICGDSYEKFNDSQGNIYLMLSDGMGKGKRAALDSVITCSVMQELIKSGFKLELALKLLNTALSVKSHDESIATIDIVKFNPYSLTAEFIKAGAATSFVYSNGILRKVEAFTLPLGILQDIEYDKKVIILNENDYIILCSDGAGNITEDLLKNIIDNNKNKNLDEINEKLYSYLLTKGICENDDITILISKITK